MGYLVKSNKTISDPNNERPIYSEYGFTSADVNDYLSRLSNQNYTLSQAQFNAIDTLVDELKSLGVWDNILEILPLVGSSIDAQAEKLKGKNSNTLSKINGIDGNYVDSDLGLIYNAYSGGPCPCFNTGLQASELINTEEGYGAILYVRPTAGSASNRHVLGAGFDGGSTYELSEKYDTDETNFETSMGNSIMSYTPSDPSIKISKHNISNGELVDRFLYEDGTKVAEPSTATYSNGGNSEAVDIYIGARNNAGSDSHRSFWGEIRFVAIHDGKLPNSLIGDINTAIDNFLIGMGKKF